VVGQEESAQGEEEQKAVVEEPEKENHFFSKYLGNPLALRLCESVCPGERLPFVSRAFSSLINNQGYN
jgi:hypothetical protein